MRPDESSRPAWNGATTEDDQAAGLIDTDGIAAASDTEDIEHARALAAAGVPIFLCKPATLRRLDGQRIWRPDGGSGKTGYWLPDDWQHTVADPAVLDDWRPGMAVCAVMGHGLDLIDHDPRNDDKDSLNGLYEAGIVPHPYGETATPSGGLHLFVRSMGVHSKTGVLPGIDVKAGIDGEGNGFAFLPPTRRMSKVDGSIGQYVWTSEFDPERFRLDGPDDQSGKAFAELVEAVQAGQRNGEVVNGAVVPVAAGTSLAAAIARADLWDDVPRLLRDGRNSGVHRLASSLRGQGVSPTLAERMLELGVWPLIDQEQAGHSFPVEEFRAAIRSAYAGYVAGQNGSAAKPVTGSSWDPIDLTGFVDGTVTLEQATLLRRTDGAGLIYPGRTHSLYGEGGSGKSFLAQHLAATLLLAGERVIYLDYESDGASVVTRLRLLGVPPDVLLKGLNYLRPETAPAVERSMFDRLLTTPAGLVVIDGVNVSIATGGGNPNDNADVMTWFSTFVDPLSESTGAAGLMVDHVAKGDGISHAMGAVMKRNMLTGAAYLVEVDKPMGRGRIGKLYLRVAKDRPGAVDAVSGEPRADRTRLAAVVTVDNATDPGVVTYKLEPPPSQSGPEAWQPTWYMERVSIALERADGLTLGVNEIVSAVGGKKPMVVKAIGELVRLSYISMTVDGVKHLHTLLKPYRQPVEPLGPTREAGDADEVGPGSRVSLRRDPVGPGDSPHLGESRDSVGPTRDPGTHQESKQLELDPADDPEAEG